MVSIIKTNILFTVIIIMTFILFLYLNNSASILLKIFFIAFIAKFTSVAMTNYSSRTSHLLSLILLSLIHLFLFQLSCKFCQIWITCSPWKCHSLILFFPCILYFLKVSIFVYNPFFYIDHLKVSPKFSVLLSFTWLHL